MNMKKHPIDDLFARKLGKNKIEPSTQAWEKLQSRLQTDDESTRLVMLPTWRIWAVAAGVSAVLVAGWLVLDRPAADATRGQMASNTRVKKENVSPLAAQKNENDVAQVPALAVSKNAETPKITNEIQTTIAKNEGLSSDSQGVRENLKRETTPNELAQHVAGVPMTDAKKVGEVTIVLQIEEPVATAKADEMQIAETPEATLSAEPIIIKKRTKLSRFLAKIRDLKSDEANEDALLARANPKANNLESKIDDLKQFNFNRKLPNN